MTSSTQPLALTQILSAYRNGLSTSRICRLFALSETRYYNLVKAHKNQFEAAKKMRLMNQKKKIKGVYQVHKGLKVKTVDTDKKITPDEKLERLENRLELERKKNEELERLLKVAQEQLGKL